MAAGNGSESVSDFRSNCMLRRDKDIPGCSYIQDKDSYPHYQLFCKKFNKRGRKIEKL